MVDQLGNPLDCPVWLGVNDEDLVGKSSDEFVSPAGGAAVGAARGLFEARDDQEATVFQCRPPLSRNPHFSQRPRQTYNNGLLSSQKNPQAFLFYWRVKTADYGYAVITELSGRVVGSEDGVTGATDRAEEGKLGEGEKLNFAERHKHRGSLVMQPLNEPGRITPFPAFEAVK
jgi:hypothetical protein